MKRLSDKGFKGKERPWKRHKLESLVIADVFDQLGDVKRVERMVLCGNCLTFLECLTCDVKKLKHARFCRERLCPMCAWRKSRLVFFQTDRMAHAIFNEYPAYRLLFLTLTVPNVVGDDLSKTVTHMMQSFKRLMERKEVKQTIKGFYRSFETTYNLETKEYHPHIHVLLLVPPKYFNDWYIKRDRWLELWKESTRQFEITQVHIERVKVKKSQTLGKATAEISKYLTKFSGFVNKVDREELVIIVSVLHKSLSGRRLHQYGGLFKEFHKRLNLVKLDKATSSDLIGSDNGECVCGVCNLLMIEKKYFWNGYHFYANDEVFLIA